MSKKSSYENWEYSYFPYLLEIYRISFEDTLYEPYCMEKYFRFLYDSSSGKISSFLRQMNKDEFEIYNNYRNTLLGL